jgi:TonB-dependent SusC/RagA subfamily outer membrane receptor
MRRPRQERVGRSPGTSLILAACVAGAACAKSQTAPPPGTVATMAKRDSVSGGGYGTEASRGKRSKSSRITQADIERAGEGQSLVGFIESHLAGVRVVPNHGDLMVIITGQSFQGDIGALVIVDGTEGSLAGLSLKDIASMEVLKDSAAAIYGVRGANGVLVVTTRKR